MATSPTPSLDSLPGATHSIGSFGEHNDYLSDSPLTLSGSSPPVSDSAICDDFSSSGVTSSLESHKTNSSSSASSTSSSSGLSCGSSSTSGSGSGSGSNNSGGNGISGGGGVVSGVIGSGLLNSTKQTQLNNININSIVNSNGTITSGVINITSTNGSQVPRCTGCKSKQSDAVAKCIDCANYLCANCVTAHQFMHCFDGHCVFHINSGFVETNNTATNNNNNNNNSSNVNTGINGLNGSSPTNSTNQINVGSNINACNNNTSNNGVVDLTSLASLNLNTNSITMLLQQQQQQTVNNTPQSQLSKLIGGSGGGGGGSGGNSGNNGFENHHHQQQQQQGQSLKSRYNYTDCGNNADLLPKLTANDLLAALTNNNASSQMQQQQQQQVNNNNNNTGNNTNTTKLTSQYFCTKHKNEILKFYCRTCQTPVCKDCIVLDHPAGIHECEHIQDTSPKQIEQLLQSITDLRGKVTELRSVVKSSEQNSARIQMHYHKAQEEINETYQFFRSTLDERKQELLKELESFYNARSVSNTVLVSKSQENIEKTLQACESVERVTKSTGVNETVMLKVLLDGKMQICSQLTQELQTNPDLAFISNYQAIQAGIRNTFGYIRSSDILPTAKQPPIARPTSTLNMPQSNSGNISPTLSTHSMNSCTQMVNLLTNHSSVLERQFSNTASNGGNVVGGSGGVASNGAGNGGVIGTGFDSNIISKRFNSANSLGPFVSDVNLQLNPYEKWSNGGSDNLYNSISDPYNLPIGSNSVQNGNGHNTIGINSNGTQSNDSIMDLTSKLLATSAFPPKSQIKRQKMIYHCKFGEFGVLEGQFTEPSGVAVNAQNDIVVADTNNHRIQIFDKEGRFKFQFGECGKRDGQLLYPNRVAVVKNSGDIVVTERSPTHQIQIYNQYGQFQRKFGANILQHPRGVTVDNKGRIIVVECKVMRVIIFDQYGVVLQKFGCSKHLEFPNGVVVNDKQEIFISDNRAHCVKVFNYEGQYLRQIGGEGITNYPIGVGINSAGEILIADNHNNFNLTIFTQDGQLVSALESKVKHAQCFDVALMDDGSVVLASKDYRLYIYRYVQVPPILL